MGMTLVMATDSMERVPKFVQDWLRRFTQEK
jgi:hypothetical protein